MSDFAKLGDYQINDLTITSHNGFQRSLMPMAMSIQVFEDIFSPNMTCRISISDDGGMLNYLPIIGQEKVSFSFMTMGGTTSINMNMIVHKISGLTTDGLSQLYNLELVTEDMIKNFEMRISERFEGSATEIAQQVFSKIGTTKQLEVEPSDDRYDAETGIVIPNMTPIKALDFLSRKAFSDTYKSSSYTFFENSKGYHLKPIEALAQGTSKNKFYLGDLKNVDGPGGQNSENKKVIDYSFDSNFSVIDNIMRGMYVGNLITVDLLTRNFKTLEHSYWDNYMDYQYMNDGPIHDVSGTGVQYNPSTLYIAPETELETGKPLQNQEKIFLQRKFHRQLMQNIKCTISVYGDSDLTVGDCIDLNVPLFSSTDPDEIDKYYSGKYLIMAIRHRLQFGRYITDIEVVKDSFNDSLPSPIPIPVENRGNAR